MLFGLGSVITIFAGSRKFLTRYASPAVSAVIAICFQSNTNVPAFSESIMIVMTGVITATTRPFSQSWPLRANLFDEVMVVIMLSY